MAVPFQKEIRFSDGISGHLNWEKKNIFGVEKIE